MVELLPVEAAQRFFGGVGHQTIYRMCASGKLEFVKVGRRYLFKPEWFEEAVTRAKLRR
jgi:excisionase family DNA binding protein